jgi:hypothetical protein
VIYRRRKWDFNEQMGAEVMRTVTTLAAAGLAICGAVGMPAGFAAADSSAQQVIANWEAQGYQVNIDRVGTGPIQNCVVTSVRNPSTITYTVRTGGRIDDTPSYLVPVVISRTVQISLNCAS